ncbi:MAG TPA: hypothetical protein VLX68_04140 [Chitinivibrionales bacterium]|nr:hypothetical protein [Chitinivibrionales bacterium]
MRKIILMGMMGLVMAGNGVAKTEGGLILSGLDTISTPKQTGFDFVTQTCCTTSINIAPYKCVNHFLINAYLATKYLLSLWPDNQNGPAYCINMDKMNLDSIKAAPSDSIFYLQPNGHGDDIPVDSLSSRIGNVYLMKTAPDPRDGYPYYAKIKIIKFIVVDSAQHQIKMVFLWAANITGYHDLTTSGLDTFHLDGTPTLTQDNSLSATSANRPLTPAVFKVATGKFFIPLALQSPGAFLSIYDLSGKQLARVSAGTGRVIDLRQFGAGRGVFVVRVSPHP